MKTAVQETVTELPSLSGLERILRDATELPATTLHEVQTSLGKITAANICTRQTERCEILVGRVAFELDARQADKPHTVDAEYRL